MDKKSVINRLRPYQKEVAMAVLESVFGNKGLTFSVEIARQGGKNELSAQLELLLMTLHITENKNLIKCSPTFKPQAVISMSRLKERLNDAGFGKIYSSEHGYIIKLGNARAFFPRMKHRTSSATLPISSLKLTNRRTSARRNTLRILSRWGQPPT